MTPNSGDSHSSKPPLKTIPGGYGSPFFGPLKDRYDYFYNQGRHNFFKTRINKYNSTIFRSNMPPGPFISSNPNVIVLLDAISFPILFDTSKVEKKNLLDGTYMPSTAFFGGHRVCAFLDPSEPNHAAIKGLFMSVLAARRHKFIPILTSCLSDLFTKLETQMATKHKSDFNNLNDQMSSDFVFRLFADQNIDPKSTPKSSIFTKWLLCQLAPLATLGIRFFPNFLEDLLLHTFPLPFLLAKSDYNKLYKQFHDSSTSILTEAENLGIERDEALHNLIFLAGFNAFGGMKAWFPTLIKWVASGGEKLHTQLADEIRTVIKSSGGITILALEKLELTKSVIYEAFRMEPPVPFQYGKAKEDTVVRSHDGAFEIKKGEMIFGYQALAMRDPMVFDDADVFVGHRFVGEGKKLLKYVYWSNGRETDDPTVENKQCPGKDLVLLMSRVILVELFLRYETFSVETGTLPFGVSVTFKSLTKTKIV